jgi:sugar lactone lactonase YvrE
VITYFRKIVHAGLIVVAGLALLGPVAGTPTASSAPAFPDRIDLPDGFLPEGISIGRDGGPVAYFGSRADGDLYRADLRTGQGEVFSQGPGTASVGLKVDRAGRLFVAGGPSGTGRAVDAGTGEILATYPFTTGESFVNDVLLTGGSAWFTDSRRAELYRLPRDGDRLPTPGEVERLPLTGEWVQAPSGSNSANGIAPTPDGDGLIVMNSSEAALFRVDPATGEATRVDLGGVPMTNGDGLLLVGNKLYVVQNRLNRVAVIDLDRQGTSGVVTGYLTSDGFNVPTTVARFGKSLYLPNAKFDDPDQVEFWATRIDRR